MVQYFAYKQSASRTVQMTLIPITFGVGYATVYDLEVNFVGFGINFICVFVYPITFQLIYFSCTVVFAICAVLSTSMAQIFTNTYQKSLDCNALQLLYHTSPVIAVVRETNSVLHYTMLQLAFHQYVVSFSFLLMFSYIHVYFL